jgi:hypothetical protein
MMIDGGTAAESGRLGMLIPNRPIPVSFPRPPSPAGLFPVSRLGRTGEIERAGKALTAES